MGPFSNRNPMVNFLSQFLYFWKGGAINIDLLGFLWDWNFKMSHKSIHIIIFNIIVTVKTALAVLFFYIWKTKHKQYYQKLYLESMLWGWTELKQGQVERKLSRKLSNYPEEVLAFPKTARCCCAIMNTSKDICLLFWLSLFPKFWKRDFLGWGPLGWRARRCDTFGHLQQYRKEQVNATSKEWY